MNWDQHERDLQERGRIDALERRVSNLERIMGRFMADIYDTIAAAITAKNSGDNAAYDQHLATLDATTQQLGTTETDQAARIAAIEAGLGKVAAAVNPPATGGATTAGADTGATGGATAGADTGATVGADAGATSQTGGDTGTGTTTGADAGATAQAQPTT